MAATHRTVRRIRLYRCRDQRRRLDVHLGTRARGLVDEQKQAAWEAWHAEHQWGSDLERAFSEAYNAGRASRDAEVAELKQTIEENERQILEDSPLNSIFG